MEIKLKPDATPSKIRRRYRWTEEQRQFLKRLLRKLTDIGIIERVESEWRCPVVLVIKPDLTWRLCVDPTELNKATVPMEWDIPRVREQLQQKLRGVRWMCKVDFTSMFWQIPLHEDSRKLFCFYAGEFGTYQFNRVAMGALNSSYYTQRMVTHMFQNAKLPDGRDLLGNGLLVQTDDVLLYADGDTEAESQAKMTHILELFLHTVAAHDLAINPSKCDLFTKSTIYCGLKVTREGIKVDPARLQGLREMPLPKNLGDVWQFNSTAGWIRDDIPLFSAASSILTDCRTKAMKSCKRRNMAAARRITLTQAGWGVKEMEAWKAIKRALEQTITTSYRDRRMQACLFTDASREGWAYVITQCPVGDLELPWGSNDTSYWPSTRGSSGMRSTTGTCRARKHFPSGEQWRSTATCLRVTSHSRPSMTTSHCVMYSTNQPESRWCL